MNTTKPQHLIRLLFAFMCIGLFTWIPQAHAGEGGFWSTRDKKDIPATGCVQINGPDRLYYDDDGSIVNLDTKKSIRVNCPLIRDHTSKDLDYVWIQVEKHNFDWCRVKVIQPTTGGSGYETRKNAKPRNEYNYVGRKYYYFHIRRDFPKGAIYMASCSLPPGARLIAFYYQENR